MLAADELIGLFMPCRISVYTKEGQTYIATLRPSAVPQFFPQAGIDAVAAEVDAALRNIIDEAK